MAAQTSPALALVGEAERALLLSDFCTAETKARELAALQTLPRELQDRGFVVALQALWETNRFELSHRLLRKCFGEVAAAPPHTLLLWLSLALDTESRREAERLILHLLDSCQPGSDAGWSRRQYLALLHLYVFDMLLPEMQEPAEVMRWLQETQLPLQPDERQLLLDELEAERAQQAQQLQRQLSASRQRRGSGAGAAGAAAVEALAAAWQDAGRERTEDDEEQGAGTVAGTQRRAGFVQGPAAGRQLKDAAAASGKQKARQPTAGAAEEIVPAEEAGCEPGPRVGLDWLGRCQQQLLQGATSLLGSLGLVPEQLRQRLGGAEAAAAGSDVSTAGRGAGLVPAAGAAAQDPADAVRQLTRTVLGCVLLYALYAERRAIKRGIRAARGFVASGAADLLRMAFNLGVNPMAVSGA